MLRSAMHESSQAYVGLSGTHHQKTPRLRGFRHAPKRTRTSTGLTSHKALNLARLPIPPPARVTRRVCRGGRRIADRCVRPPGPLPSRTSVRFRHRLAEEPSRMDLTKRQQEIYDYIKRYAAEHGYPPTVRDIGKAVGLASSSTVHAHLANLEKLGLLRRDPAKPRAMELLNRMREEVGTAVGTAVEQMQRAMRPGLPLVGQVAAGQPILADENIEDYVNVPPIAGGEEGEYVLRGPGEAMEDV